MKFTRILAFVLAACASASVAAQDLPDRVKKAGKLVVAMQPNYPPIVYRDPTSNQLLGFDIELGEAIGKELGVKIEWQETAFAQVFSSIATGRVDMAMIGISDLPARRDNIDFVDYFKSGAQYYTGSATGIKTQADLCGRKVGASRSTNWPKQIEEWSQANCVAKGKPSINVVGTEGSVDARTQLKSGRIDAGVQGNETLPYFQSQEPNTFVIVGEPFTESIVGIPVAKTEPQLRDAIKGALERLQKNGAYDKLLAKYSLQSSRYTPIAINQGKQ